METNIIKLIKLMTIYPTGNIFTWLFYMSVGNNISLSNLVAQS